METGRAITSLADLQPSTRLRVVAPYTGACATCTVRSRVICGILEPGEREELARLGRIQSVPRGTTLLWEGEEARLVANVLEGVLKLSTSTADGREQILGVAYVSDFVGRPFAHTSPYRITALTDARVCIFPRSAFDRYAREHPALEHFLLERTLADLDRAHAQLLDLGRRTATERVASFLLDLSQRLADAGCGAHTGSGPNPPLDQFDLPLDRQQIGDLMGLAIETVSRTFQKLKAAKILDLPGRRAVHIRDRRRLEAAAGL